MILNLTKKERLNDVIDIEISRIVFNPAETDFSDAEISMLADKIAENGISEPFFVRKSGERYELIFDKKRLIAAKMCEFHSVPCIVHEISDRDSAILVLVKRIQHQNMSFFDEASAIEQLINYYGMTQEEAASRLGRAQSTIANKLRLLRLTSAEREIIMENGLTERHSRALLKVASVEDRAILLDRIINDRLNVDRTEILINEFIGKQKEHQVYKRRVQPFKNMNVFINSISKSVEAMKLAGIMADFRQIKSDSYIEYRIRIPIKL